MLNKKQIHEIKEHLDKAQNPIFYYDNDADGLCSFVLLRKFIGRGKGVAVRSFPDLNASYARKAAELNADYVFVLDKPVISKEFVKEIDNLGLPLVWIDHHDLPIEEYEKDFENFFVYNSARGKSEGEPVTYLSYKISGRKEDLWLAIAGCIADHYLPDFADDFAKEYSDLWGRVKEPFDAYYKTEIGKIAVGLNFGLKDSVTNVVRLQNFLISCAGPRTFFQELSENYYFRKKYFDIKKKYDSLLKDARKTVERNLIFFEYAGELSISADLSNELSYLHSNKFVVVAYRNGGIANLSIRGKGVKAILTTVLAKVGGSGGGHENAVGARIGINDLGRFKEEFKNEISK